MQTSNKKSSKLDKLVGAKPKAVNLSREQLVKIGSLQPGQTLPQLIEPATDGLDLCKWAHTNGDLIENELTKTGAILFRGFNVPSTGDFEKFTRVLAPELMDYSERSSPRHKVKGSVYTSTDHPADQPIVLHNEQSYTLNWMMKLWFYCVTPADEGGCTPIADSRKILGRLSPTIREKFQQKQVMYMRNYGVGLGLSWREAFQTDDRADVEQHCQKNDIQFEWIDDERLRTRQVRPAIRIHPKTNDAVWFNHALFFHISSLESKTRESIMAGLDENEYPFNTYYGDGTAFESSVLDEIRSAYDEETITFPWQANDILMLDNMLVAHGREPFVGQRKVVVAMAEPFQNASTISTGT